MPVPRVTIDELPLKATPDTDDLVVLHDSGTTKHTTIAGVRGILVQSGAGSPEGVVTAAVGTLYLRTDGGTGTTLYVKETGAADTGWIAK